MNPQKQLDETIRDFIRELDIAASDRNARIYEAVLVLSGRLKTRRNGTIVASAENLKVVEAIKKEVSALLADSAYATTASGIDGGFIRLAGTLDLYFVSVVDTYRQNAELAKAIRQANVRTTIESLLGSGVDANFTQPLTKLLRQHVAGNATLKDLTAALRLELMGNNDVAPRLNRYAGQVASDALQQFERNYTSAVSYDLKLDHFLYAGTSINDTRDFCRTRTGKVFTRQEVEGWASLDWAGRIRGTTKANIQVYLGGYGCRHRLLPISETTYEKLKNPA